MKTMSISFTEYKRIRKEYLTLINNCKCLILHEKAGGVTKVLEALERRYKSHSATLNDIKTLKYIIDHYEFLRFKITWY